MKHKESQLDLVFEGIEPRKKETWWDLPKEKRDQITQWRSYWKKKNTPQEKPIPSFDESLRIVEKNLASALGFTTAECLPDRTCIGPTNYDFSMLKEPVSKPLAKWRKRNAWLERHFC